MEYIHVKNIEKFHPGYRDRSLQWAKIHCQMVQGDPDCELINNETDWGRLIKFILLELQAKKPIPLNDRYLSSKGFDLKKRPIQLTLQMLHNFLEIVTQDEKLCGLEKSRVDKSRVPLHGCVTDEILKYLNLKAKRNFLLTNKASLKFIGARLNEGRTIDDFKKVIDKKCTQWLDDEKMSEFLRPQTLFSPSHFDNYLNQPDPKVTVTKEMEDLS